MAEPGPQIKCPLFLKSKGEWTIKQLTRDINEAKVVSDKAERAEELENEVEMLVFCEKYDRENEDCKNCKIISTLRKQAAELLIRTRGLEG